METIRTLLKDPVYKKYFLRPPRLWDNLSHGNPFAVWGLKTESGRWAKLEVPTYERAFTVVKQGLAKRTGDTLVYADMVIVSKRQFFAPPIEFYLDPHLGWCSRCRRPVKFGFFTRHHAMPNPIRDLAEDARCPLCGIRRAAMREY